MPTIRRTSRVWIARAKSFLTNVSHELRTPLSSIKLMLETVVESPDDEAADLVLAASAGASRSLDALVQQLLEQARAESGQLQAELTRRRSRRSRCIRSWLVRAAGRRTRACNSSCARSARCAWKPIPIVSSQVFVNLIDNALRHTPSRGGFVTVELDATGNDAIMRVRDTGDGHSLSRPAAYLRALLRRRPIAHARKRRRRAGSRDRQGHRRRARRDRFQPNRCWDAARRFTVRLPIMRVAARELTIP